jgi:hypothetical protein
MRRIREVLRLRHQGLTERVIARMLGVSNGVVHGYVRRARLAGLSWPLPEGMDDEGLELLLFPAPMAASQSDRRPAPDWVYVEKELRRRSVTRLLLWEEYRRPAQSRPQNAFNEPRTHTASDEIPIASNAPPRPTSRGFLP